ncbi:MAG: hypothetical protein RJB39_62 [Candidatus Parcubacteria bacterium]|jgi:ribosomal protein S18 acetylase RimI-like enzyme
MKILTTTDWQKLKALRIEGWQTDPQAFWGDPKLEIDGEEEYWHERLTDPKSFYVGIEEDGKLVSVAGGRWHEDEKSWALMAVYTSVPYRGKRFSKQLVNMVTDEVKKKGGTKIMLYVTEGQNAAISMYEKMGFTHIGVEADCKMGDGKRHNELIMEKEL